MPINTRIYLFFALYLFFCLPCAATEKKWVLSDGKMIKTERKTSPKYGNAVPKNGAARIRPDRITVLPRKVLIFTFFIIANPDRKIKSFYFSARNLSYDCKITFANKTLRFAKKYKKCPKIL